MRAQCTLLILSTRFWATRHRNNALGQEVRSIMRLAIGNDGQNSNAEELFTSARLPACFKSKAWNMNTLMDGHRGPLCIKKKSHNSSTLHSGTYGSIDMISKWPHDRIARLLSICKRWHVSKRLKRSLKISISLFKFNSSHYIFSSLLGFIQ